jgi:hypothetical protein
VPLIRVTGVMAVIGLIFVVYGGSLAAAMAGAALLARRVVGAPPWAAVVAACAVGAGPVGLVYASQVYPEAPAALCLALACLWTQRPTSRPERSQTVGLIASVVALEWLGVKYLPYAVLLVGVWAWPRRRDVRRLATVGAVGAVAAAHFVWWHVRTFGGLTPYATNVVYAGEGTAAILTQHLSLGWRSYRLYGLFLDARFGLFRWLPVAPLALWGVVRRAWVHVAVLAIAVLLGTFVSITMMGYWFPGRMLVAAFPGLVVLVALGLVRLPRVGVGLAVWGWAIAAALAVAASPAVRSVRLAVDPWVLGSPPLAPAWLFPDFRWFGVREVAISLAWGVVLVGLSIRVPPRT